MTPEEKAAALTRWRGQKRAPIGRDRSKYAEAMAMLDAKRRLADAGETPRNKNSLAVRKDFIDRFWNFVRRERGGGRHWIWTGAVDHNGTGKFWMLGSTRSAPRVAWEISRYEPPPPRLKNRCGVRQCVRPAHYSRDGEKPAAD